MKHSLNEEIIATIRNSLPANENIVSFLADLFFWSKEAIYRRLRCEIAFTFEDIVRIATKLDFSLDNIVRLNQQHRVLFDMHLPQSSTPVELYCEKRELLTNISKQISVSKVSDSVFALNYVPYSFILFRKTLTKFDYYKWIHQMHMISPDVPMSKVVVPLQVTQMRETWINQDRNNSSVTYILDNNVFLAIIREIDYFYRRGLIDNNELELMQEELLDMIGELVYVSSNLKSYSGSSAQMYISPIDIATNHFYIRFDDSICAYVQVHGIDILQSYYPEACKSQKDWLEFHKRYSTLITKCNEVERFEYFNKQSDYVKNWWIPV